MAPVKPSGFGVPILTLPDDSQNIASMGIDRILLDGKPFPWATTAPWTIEIGDDRVTTLTVHIAVRFGPAPAEVFVGEDGETSEGILDPAKVEALNHQADGFG